MNAVGNGNKSHSFILSCKETIRGGGGNIGIVNKWNWKKKIRREEGEDQEEETEEEERRVYRGRGGRAGGFGRGKCREKQDKCRICREGKVRRVLDWVGERGGDTPL